MKTFRLLLTALFIVALLPFTGARAGAEVSIDRGKIPVDEVVHNDCTGEDVRLTGTMVWVGHGVLTNSGVEQWNYQMNYQGVIGVGLTSGIRFRGIGGEHGTGSMVVSAEQPFHYAAGMIQTMHLVGQGQAENMRIKYHVRVTVTPDFRYTVEIFDYEAVCK